MSSDVQAALAAWDKVAQAIPTVVQVLGPDSDASKALLLARDSVESIKAAVQTGQQPIERLLAVIAAVLPHVTALMSPAVGTAVGVAISLAEAGFELVSATPVQVVVRPVQPGTPPRTVDGEGA